MNMTVPERPELIVALDFATPDEALAMAGTLRSSLSWAKVGLELFTVAGPSLVGRLKDMGYRVFLDLKFLDIPTTVKRAVRAAGVLGADIVDVHLSGGRRMAEAAAEGRDSLPPGSPRPLLFGITVLTSMEASDLTLFRETDPERLALGLARLGKDATLDGAVCSALEVPAIKKACGDDHLCLTPGIRLAALGDDQKRVVTPARAVSLGSDFLVVGRPITASPDPVEAARQMLRNMREGAREGS